MHKVNTHKKMFIHVVCIEDKMKQVLYLVWLYI